ncbi:hypothetical protein CAL26_05030 [Bordetella genomosp. 9]|uniref:Uncharacterized protein n=1 Tax=Bordetella genomosp. 9 TaxID=1416803 RepID=A0A261RPH9_9BORD|nr:hypothetical protein [Bordetella genomosp. 9]OZI26687.1 hypothetical protein CAL26_05030 [Bordetella genomosp. 9]
MNLIQEIEAYGEVRDEGCVLKKQNGNYQMREARNVCGPHRHDLAGDISLERLEAHWEGFKDNVNA